MSNQQKVPLLTIGIPTYNRHKILQQLLDQLSPKVSKYNGEIEIFISDNASTDNTSKIVNAFIADNPYIRLHSNQENLGFDANVNNVMKQSTGEYVWLLGDDDYVLDESVDYILSVIEQNTDVAYILMNYCSRFDKEFSIPSSLELEDRVNKFNHNEFFSNVKTASSLLSANIYKREFWDFDMASNYVGSGYIHLLMISNIVFSRTALVLDTVLVEQRSSSDSLLINTGSSGAELEVNYEHLVINNKIKYPIVFWAFDINVKLRRILMNDLQLLGYDKKVISKIDLSTQIETLRQSIYLKRSDKSYSFVELSKLIYFTFLEYKYRYIFWLFTLPVLILPRKLFQWMLFIIEKLNIKLKLSNYS